MKRIVIITSIIILSVLLILNNHNIYIYTGGDYWFQTLPMTEYLRESFWATHNVFPQLNMNYGMLQNMAVFYYYGVYNPFIILSYFLPFISTHLYLEFETMLVIVVSFIIGYYVFEDKKNTSEKLIGAALIAGAGGIIHQGSYYSFFHESYIGFLLIILGIKNLFYGKKGYWFIIGSVLIYMINFTFMLAYTFFAGIYVIYLIFKEKKNLKYFLEIVFKLIIYSIISLLLSAFIIFPQLYLILSGGRFDGYEVNYGFFLPLSNFFSYLQQGLLLMYFTIITIILSVYYKKKEACIALFGVLSATVILPLTKILQLNESVHSKVLYGATVILAIIFIDLITEVKKRKDYKFAYNLFLSTLVLMLVDKLQINNLVLNKTLFILSIALIVYILIRKKMRNFILESIILFLMFINFNQLYDISEAPFIALISYLPEVIYLLCIIMIFVLLFKKSRYIYYVISLFLILSFFNFSEFRSMNKEDIISKSEMTSYSLSNYDLYRDPTDDENLTKVVNLDDTSTDIYTSLENSHYFNHFRNIVDFQQNSIDIRVEVPNSKITNSIYGVKGKYDEMEIKPIIYGTTNIYSIDNYMNIAPEYRFLKELQGIYINNSDKDAPALDEYVDKIYEGSNYSFEILENSDYIYTNKYGSGEMIISFDVSDMCQPESKSNKIGINGQYNSYGPCGSRMNSQNDKFTFYIPVESGEDIDVTLNAAKYNISNLKVWFISDENINKLNSSYTSVENLKVYFNNGFEFNISMPENGYINTTIPYDNGFSVYIDSEESDIETCNNDFLCFPISEGKHDVKITYNIPMFKIGIFISLGTISVMIIYVIKKRYL